MNFIADIGSNHNQDLVRTMKLIDIAAGIGCDAVKFQLFRVDKMYAPEVLGKSKQHRDLTSRELPLEFIPHILFRCLEQKIMFICTPFYLDAVKELAPYVHAFKIGSFEILWLDMIRACADTGKPVFLSTGMASMDEIRAAVSIFPLPAPLPFLMHCVSGYPAPPSQANLARIDLLREEFSIHPGYSDHTVSEAVICRAVHHWGASNIEFHLDLDGSGAEYSHGHCWTPDRAKIMIESVRAGIEADGNGSMRPALCEIQNVKWRADIDGQRPQKHERREWNYADAH